ncbi:helix-hairpin-helix domain-containing protein [Brachybacterium sp. AOP43-C2-M15]|uniref:helix-hairpin-helix domain-containing protein n=1 Tax=Brachybacterium sp. AOP43-C2-M15 TaxID=3457661 RepID=UPI0040334E08
MGAQERSTRGRAGRHRRTGRALIERRDHTEGDSTRRRSLPAPSPSALIGLAVLVLIGLGAVHLSGSGTAVPLEAEPVQEEPAATVPAATATDATAPDDAPEREAEPAASATPQEVVVHVSGAVAAAGVVRLPAGSRVDDALEAVGGPTQEADLTAVNLARPLADGEQIHVPVPGEAPPPLAGPDAGEEAAPGSAEGGASGDGQGDRAGTIDLNAASAAELEELPGVGPAIAQRIVEHRERNGPFTAVEGLLEVSGIGPATLEKMRDRATV